MDIVNRSKKIDGEKTTSRPRTRKTTVQDDSIESSASKSAISTGSKLGELVKKASSTAKKTTTRTKSTTKKPQPVVEEPVTEEPVVDSTTPVTPETTQPVTENTVVDNDPKMEESTTSESNEIEKVVVEPTEDTTPVAEETVEPTEAVVEPVEKATTENVESEETETVVETTDNKETLQEVDGNAEKDVSTEEEITPVMEEPVVEEATEEETNENTTDKEESEEENDLFDQSFVKETPETEYVSIFAKSKNNEEEGREEIESETVEEVVEPVIEETTEEVVKEVTTEEATPVVEEVVEPRVETTFTNGEESLVEPDGMPDSTATDQLLTDDIVEEESEDKDNTIERLMAEDNDEDISTRFAKLLSKQVGDEDEETLQDPDDMMEDSTVKEEINEIEEVVTEEITDDEDEEELVIKAPVEEEENTTIENTSEEVLETDEVETPSTVMEEVLSVEELVEDDTTKEDSTTENVEEEIVEEQAEVIEDTTPMEEVEEITQDTTVAEDSDVAEDVPYSNFAGDDNDLEERVEGDNFVMTSSTPEPVGEVMEYSNNVPVDLSEMTKVEDIVSATDNTVVEESTTEPAQMEEKVEPKKEKKPSFFARLFKKKEKVVVDDDEEELVIKAPVEEEDTTTENTANEEMFNTTEESENSMVDNTEQVDEQVENSADNSETLADDQPVEEVSLEENPYTNRQSLVDDDAIVVDAENTLSLLENEDDTKASELVDTLISELDEENVATVVEEIMENNTTVEEDNREDTSLVETTPVEGQSTAYSTEEVVEYTTEETTPVTEEQVKETTEEVVEIVEEINDGTLLNTSVALNESDLEENKETPTEDNTDTVLYGSTQHLEDNATPVVDSIEEDNSKVVGDINLFATIGNATPSSEILKEEKPAKKQPKPIADIETIYTMMGIEKKQAVVEDKEIKVLYCASECQPFVASGGLADVAGSLPKAIAEKGGVDIRVIMPLYGNIKAEYKEKFDFLGNFTVHLSWRQEYCGLFRYFQNGVTYYFIDNERYFKRDSLYGYFDDGERFAYFSKAIVEALAYLNFFPDILHCNDWQTALVSTYIKTGNWSDRRYYGIKFIYTIHNVEYQGVYGMNNLKDLFGIDYRFINDLDYNGDINLTKAAIQYCDKLTTVSNSYCENLKEPYCSRGLHHIILRNQYKLSGIINGIDYDFYNPATDTCLTDNYDIDSIEKKVLNKKKWQDEIGLPVDGDTPMIAVVSRLVGHKGIDLVNKIVHDILQKDIQLVIVGTGDQRYVDIFKNLEQQYPTKVRAFVDKYSNEIARKAYAASDIFIMPSKVEPCGLSQMIASRYGSVPIVREVGGLKDSIKDFGCKEGGNGYTFTHYNAGDLQYQLERAIKDYKDKKGWRNKMEICMSQDFTWNNPANKYIELYKSITDN